MEKDNIILKVTCQCCNGFGLCSGRSVELLYITFIHDRMSTIELYPEEVVPEKF